MLDFFVGFLVTTSLRTPDLVYLLKHLVVDNNAGSCNLVVTYPKFNELSSFDVQRE